MKATTVRLDDETRTAIEGLAKARGIKPSEYMRDAIALQLARDLAAIGDAKHLAALVAATAKDVDRLAAQLAETLER